MLCLRLPAELLELTRSLNSAVPMLTLPLFEVTDSVEDFLLRLCLLAKLLVLNSTCSNSFNSAVMLPLFDTTESIEDFFLLRLVSVVLPMVSRDPEFSMDPDFCLEDFLLEVKSRDFDEAPRSGV